MATAVKAALFETRLLNAGHPLQPTCPPVPLHIPPPGQEPDCCCVAAMYVVSCVPFRAVFGSAGAADELGVPEMIL